MKKITSLEPEKGRKQRVRVYLDGRAALRLEVEVALKEGLSVGRELTDDEISRLTSLNQYHKCFNAALHFLSFRPRSESEVKERLKRRGFPESDIESVTNKLRQEGLVDDVAFAGFFRENREHFSPRSQRMMAVELARKGVPAGIIDAAVTGIDDSESAYRAASGKAERLPHTDYQGFRRRLGGYLKRRGFSYEVINTTIERLWREQGGTSR